MIDCVYFMKREIPGGKGWMVSYCHLEEVDPNFDIWKDCPVDYCELRDLT
jgi:hypothetical protein